jgi:hypothetical protein
MKEKNEGYMTGEKKNEKKTTTLTIMFFLTKRRMIIHRSPSFLKAIRLLLILVYDSPYAFDHINTKGFSCERVTFLFF